MPDIAGVHHISFSVPDVDRSAEWYTRVLGLTKIREMEDTGGRGRKIILLHPGSKLVIGFTVHQANEGGGFSEFHTGLDHVAFRVADRGALEEWETRFEELGVGHSPIKESAMGHLIVFRDPDNIQLEVYAAGQ